MVERIEVEAMEIVRVGIAEGAVARYPVRIRTTGLGSCVGVVLYDPTTSLSGMVHVMLPNMPLTGNLNPAKYADSGIPWLMEEMQRAGANVHRLRAKFAGGAQMFAFAGKSDIMRVGPRNVEAVTEALNSFRIPIISTDVGGNVGRTIEFDGPTEALWIKTAMKGSYSI